MDVCNACFKEVRWDPDELSNSCNQDTCVSKACGKNGGTGRFVHIGLDCGGFKWPLTGLERET